VCVSLYVCVGGCLRRNIFREYLCLFVYNLSVCNTSCYFSPVYFRPHPSYFVNLILSAFVFFFTPSPLHLHYFVLPFIFILFLFFPSFYFTFTFFLLLFFVFFSSLFFFFSSFLLFFLFSIAMFSTRIACTKIHRSSCSRMVNIRTITSHRKYQEEKS
jgi:hypothetical protein